MAGNDTAFDTAIKVPGEPALSEYSAALMTPGVFAYFTYALISETTPVFPATNPEAPFLFALIRFWAFPEFVLPKVDNVGVCAPTVIVVKTDSMLRMKSAVKHSAAGFASFLMFIGRCVFFTLFFFISLSSRILEAC